MTTRKSTKAEKTLNRILDAALRCYEASGIAGTRLEDVAREAEIGRTTLYRYVDNRDDLLAKVIQRDASEQLEELEILNRYQRSLADGMVDSVAYIMRGRRSRPINKLLFAGEGAINQTNLSPATIYPLAERLFAPQFYLAQERGELRDGVTLDEANRWITRVILSLITYPEEFLEDEEALRKFVRQYLVPSLVKVHEHGVEND